MAPTAPVATAMPARRPRVVAWTRLGDEALARKAAAGNQAAFTALYERYHGPLLGYCRSILLNVEDAGDAAQTALESALRALPDREPGRPLRPWLYRIAHNAAIDILRKRRPQVELGPLTEPAVDGPEVDTDARWRLTQLVADLRTLPPRQRGALVMRELNGLDYEEIGLALGLSPAGARRAVFDARSALHDFADGRAAECTTIRRSLSDGDRRSLRARRIRAHLRSCNDCATFQRAIRARRTDLLALTPWLTGAATAGVMGLGAGTATAGALLGGGSAAGAGAGAGLGWAGLPAAAKGLAVAAAVATTGTAAVQIERAATKPDRPAPRAQSATAQRTAPAVATAPGAAEHQRERAVAAQRARARARARAGRGNAVRTSSARLQTSAVTAAPRRRSARRRAVRRLDAPPAPVAAPRDDGVRIVDERSPASGPAVTSTTELVRRRLDAARQRILEAFDLAQRTAAGGGSGALESARTILDRTLTGVRATLERVLASVGLKLPAASAPAPGSSGSNTLAGILQPAGQVLSAIQSLLRRLLGQR